MANQQDLITLNTYHVVLAKRSETIHITNNNRYLLSITLEQDDDEDYLVSFNEEP